MFLIILGQKISSNYVHRVFSNFCVYIDSKSNHKKKLCSNFIFEFYPCLAKEIKKNSWNNYLNDENKKNFVTAQCMYNLCNENLQLIKCTRTENSYF